MRITRTVKLVTLCVVAFSAMYTLQFARIEFMPASVAEKKSGTRRVHGFRMQGAGQQWDDDGCGLAHDTSSVTRSRLSADEVHSFNVLKECVQRTFLEKGANMVDPLSPEMVSNLTALRCNQNITQSTIQLVVEQSGTIWFIGDSILEQQFYVFLCMVHPKLELPEIKYSSQRPGTPLETIAAHFTYNHSMGSTNIIYSKFGHVWHPDETNLYVDAFPKAVAALTEKDSIILDASAHYNSEVALKLERALNCIGNRSQDSNASIFYMEPTPDEWPTSNGHFTMGCMWFCTCESLDAARMMGRGSLHSDPNVGAEKLISHLEVPIDFFGKRYPDLAFANNTESCVPDCLPATWRMELARSIFETTNNRVHMVPLWYQLVGRLTAMTHVGDCTHKSLEAVLMMNHQLLRSMVRSKSQLSSRNNRMKRKWLANWNLPH
jgi:hypothetical protein